MSLNKKCITRTPVTTALIFEFGETKVGPLLDKYFPTDLPTSFKEFYDKAKDDLGVMSKVEAKKELSLTYPSKLSSAQAIDLRQKISEINNKNFAKGITIKYRTVNVLRQGKTDLYSWDIQKLNAPLNLSTKIERAKSRLVDTSTPIINQTDQGKLFNINTPSIKPGVSELFESNPELANTVYEALGYKEYSQKTKDKLSLTESLKDIFKDKSTVLFRAGEDSDAFYVDLVKTSDNRYFMFLENQSPVEMSEKRFAEEVEFINGQIATTEEKDNFINNYLKIADIDQISENPLLTKEEKLAAQKDILKKVTPEQKQQAQQLYSQYLDTIFPDSKVKDIVYHGTNRKFEQFNKDFLASRDAYKSASSLGFYFTTSKNLAKKYLPKIDTDPFGLGEKVVDTQSATMINAILNIKNPIKISEETFGNIQSDIKKEDFESEIDSLSIDDYTFSVFNPNQIHILGSKQDIKGFENFIKETKSLFNITAYHGSPSKFDEFSLDFLKTGEGNTLFGKGLYFTDSEDIGKYYSKSIRKWNIKGIDLSDDNMENGIMKGVMRIAISKFLLDKLYITKQDIVDTFDKMLSESEGPAGKSDTGMIGLQRLAIDSWKERLKKVKNSDIEISNGYFYKVEINDTGKTWLDWEQPVPENLPIDIDKTKPLKLAFRELKSQDDFLKQIEKNNVIGIKYPSGTITAEGTGSTNYVVFDDSVVNIISTNQIDVNKVSYQTKANERTIKKLKELLSSIGVKIEVTDEILNTYGAYGVADTFNRLIQVAQDKEDVVLAEETMHMVSMMLPEEILQEMMDKIEEYDLYKNTYKQYKDIPQYQKNGVPNIEKIKIEAIGKLLAEYYIGNIEEKETNTIKSWWSKIVDWFKGLFLNNKDIFQSTIADIINGDIILNPEISSNHIFFNSITDQENINEYQKILLDATNLKYLEKINKLISKISDNDMRVIQNNMNNLTGVINKQALESSKKKFTELVEEKDPKDRLNNFINYIVSLNAASKTFRYQAREIRDNIAKIDPEDKMRVRMFNNLNYLNSISSIIGDNALTLNSIINTLNSDGNIEAFNDLSKVLEDIGSDSSFVSKLYSDQRKSTLSSELDVFLKVKRENWLKQKRLERATYEKRLSSDPNNKELKLKLDLVNKEIDKGLALGEEIINMLENPEEKLSPISDLLITYFDGDLNSKKQDVQALANYMNNNLLESYREATPYINKLQDLFKKYKISPTDIDAAFSKFLQPITKIVLDERTGEYSGEEQDLVLISKDNQFEFDNDLTKLKALKATAIRIGDPQALEDVKEQIRFLIDTYGSKKYTDEYYQIQSILDSVVDPLTGEEINVRELRNKIIEEIDDLNIQILPGQPPFVTESILNEIDVRWNKFKRLESIYYEDGTDKTGVDLLIAEAIKKWKDAKSQWEEEKTKETGKKQEFTSYYITAQSRVNWEEQKKEIDLKFKNAIDAVIANPADEKIAKAFSNIKLEKDNWYKRNTVEEISKQAFEDRDKITKQIDDLSKSYDSGLKQSLQVLWKEMFDLVKGYRDENQIIIGTNLVHIQDKIKDKEEEIEQVKESIKMSLSIPPDVKELINAKWAELSEIQTVSLTEYWDHAYNKVLSDIKIELYKTNSDHEQVDATAEFDILSSKWFKDNTINVTERFKNVDQLPDTVYQVGNQIYMPTYQWRRTRFNETYNLGMQPSMRWKQPTVNKLLINPSHTTVDGRISIKPNSGRYYNPEYDKLTENEKAFLEEYRELYNEVQQLVGRSVRPGNFFPVQQASGLERFKQRVVNAKAIRLSSLTKKSTYENLFNINTTKESEFGEGKSERFTNNDKVFVYAKMINSSIPLNRRSKNMYKVMVDYILEASRYNKMRELKPLLEEALQSTKNSSKKKQIEYSIHKFVNKSIKQDKGFFRTISNIADFNLSAAGFFRLGIPYPTGIIKNQLQGTWQILSSSNLFKGYTQEKFYNGYLRAYTKAHDIYFGNVNEELDKYTAIVRYLNVMPGFNIEDARKQFGSNTLKAVDNFRYFLGSIRGMGEMQLSLTPWEMFKEDFRIGGKTIDESFEYKDGKLTVINPKLNDNAMNYIRNSIFNMNTFVQGNFDPSNSPLIKAQFWGRMLTFMTNWFYPALIRRVGLKRQLSTGQEEEGAYFVLARILKESPKLLASKDLTIQEKKSLQILLYDWGIVNIIGIGMYMLNLALKDDDDEQGDFDALGWASILLKKTYTEISFFNPIEQVGSPIKQSLYGGSNSFKSNNKAMNLFNYFFTNPLINKALPAAAPVDLRDAYFGPPKSGVKHPFYKNFEDDILMMNMVKTINFMPEGWYPKSAKTGYNYYNPSLYDYIETKE